MMRKLSWLALAVALAAPAAAAWAVDGKAGERQGRALVLLPSLLRAGVPQVGRG
jgi:hypothetical protein